MNNSECIVIFGYVFFELDIEHKDVFSVKNILNVYFEV